MQSMSKRRKNEGKNGGRKGRSVGSRVGEKGHSLPQTQEDVTTEITKIQASAA